MYHIIHTYRYLDRLYSTVPITPCLFRRHALWLLIGIFACIEVVSEGETVVDAVYVRRKFEFDDNNEYGDWSVIISILSRGRLHYVTKPCDIRHVSV